MRVLALLVGCALPAFVSLAATAEKLHIPFRPAAGAEWIVTEKKTLETNEPGKPSGTGVVTARLKVIWVGASSMEMAWTTVSVATGNQVLDGVNPAMLIGVPLHFEADTSGTPIRIIKSVQLFETLTNTFESTSPADPTVIEQTMQLFRSTDPSTLAKILMREAAAIGLCHNLSMDDAAPTHMQETLPVLGNAPPILTNYVAEVTSRGSPTEPARFRLHQSLDPASATASMVALIESMREQRGLPPETGPLPVFSRETDTTCDVDTLTGDMRSTTIDMISRTGDIQRRDLREISIVRVDVQAGQEKQTQ